jgi:hypothetical protein
VSWSGAGAAVEMYALAKHSPLLYAARAHEITASGPLSFPRQLSELSSVLAPNAQGQETGGAIWSRGQRLGRVRIIVLKRDVDSHAEVHRLSFVAHRRLSDRRSEVARSCAFIHGNH